jgi:glucarate dehydratase
MKITAVRVTPIAVKDPALLNAAGVHEPFGLRSIIEVVGANGLVGLGETYGDAPVLDLLTRSAPTLVGLSAFDVNGMLARVAALAPKTKTGHVEMELAPGSLASNLVTSAFSAFEVAFMDLQARSIGIPLVALLGGAVRNKVAYSAYLFYKWDASVDPEYAPDVYGEAVNAQQIVKQAKQMIDQYGFESIKLKAGVFDPLEEADAVLALRAAFPSHQLRIDPNSNWSMATSLKVAEKLDGVRQRRHRGQRWRPARRHCPALGPGAARQGAAGPQGGAGRSARRGCGAALRHSHWLCHQRHSGGQLGARAAAVHARGARAGRPAHGHHARPGLAPAGGLHL